MGGGGWAESGCAPSYLTTSSALLAKLSVWRTRCLLPGTAEHGEGAYSVTVENG